MAVHLQEHECLALSGIRSKGKEIGCVIFRRFHGGQRAIGYRKVWKLEA
jgi:hypothetical protein